MGLAEIKAAGEKAAMIVQAALNMNKINNEHRPFYDALLADIQAVYPGKTMQTMTEEEVNNFFFQGIADASTLAQAMGDMKEWEDSILFLSDCVSRLSANNL